jgi:hypothetical protein
MAAWKPGSRGGAKTGATPRHRQMRVTRPTESGVLVSALEAGVVVELSVGRQAKLFPVFQHGLGGFFGGDERSSPRAHQTAMERDDVEHLDIDSAFNDKAGDDVKAVQFGFALGEGGQIPATWWGWTAHSSAPVQSSLPLQDSRDRSDAGNLAISLSKEFPMDGGVAVFAQRTGLLQLPTDAQDCALNGRADAVGRTTAGTRSAICPVNTVKPLPFSALDPRPQREVAEPELTRNRSYRAASTNSRDHRATLGFSRVFLPRSLLEAVSLEQTTARPKMRSLQPSAARSLWTLRKSLRDYTQSSTVTTTAKKKNLTNTPEPPPNTTPFAPHCERELLSVAWKGVPVSWRLSPKSEVLSRRSSTADFGRRTSDLYVRTRRPAPPSRLHSRATPRCRSDRSDDRSYDGRSSGGTSRNSVLRTEDRRSG